MLPITCAVVCMLHLYCCDPHEQITDIVEPVKEANATVIFLHGAGESGPMLRQNVESLIGNLSQFPSTRFIFPTAQPAPFDPFPWWGQTINVWYNAEACKLDTKEDADLIDISAEQITRLVEGEEASGIPHNRICVVGYSAGGFMSVHYGYEYVKNLGCVGAISSFLSTKSALYKKLASEKDDIGKDLPPLYLASTSFDMLVPPSFTEKTAEVFRSAGVPTTYVSIWGKNHFLSKEVLDGLFRFIFKNLP